MKKDTEKNVVLCFDMQQVQCLLKLLISEAFYLRRLEFSCFCVTNKNLNIRFFYTWTKNFVGCGADEIASTLIHFLRLFADGYSGQDTLLWRIWLCNFINNFPVDPGLICLISQKSYLIICFCMKKLVL